MMTNNKRPHRLSSFLSEAVQQRKKALALFLTAGYPTIQTTVPLALELARAGADIIELGMPFSDPIADGPMIQKSSNISLAQGITLQKILCMVREIRRSSAVPIVLMGYLNPILKYGALKFFSSAARAGADGIILPELPYEESTKYAVWFQKLKLAHIMLVAPTTPPERVALIDKSSSGFLYCVSTTGVTGAMNHILNSRYINGVRKSARKNPVLVGFGINSLHDARIACRNADGVIIGSELIRRLDRGDSFTEISRWVRLIKDGIEKGNCSASRKPR